MRKLRSLLVLGALALLPGCVVSAGTGAVYGGYSTPYYGPPVYAPAPRYYPRPYYRPHYGPPRGYGYYGPRPYYGRPPGYYRGW